MNCTNVNCKHYRKPKKKDIIQRRKLRSGYILYPGIPEPEWGGCSKPYCMKRGGK